MLNVNPLTSESRALLHAFLFSTSFNIFKACATACVAFIKRMHHTSALNASKIARELIEQTTLSQKRVSMKSMDNSHSSRPSIVALIRVDMLGYRPSKLVIVLVEWRCVLYRVSACRENWCVHNIDYWS